MRREQKVVGVGAVSGVAAMLLALAVLTPHLRSAAEPDLAARLAVAIRWDALAVLPLLLAIMAIGNARAMSEAIDPTAARKAAR